MMAVFAMMALGLNMVVGYAGLLDLGYVAFFAIGAYMRRLVRLAALRRPDFATGCRRSTSTSARSASSRASAASTSRSGSSSSSGRSSRPSAGIVIGLPTLRLRGDYLAIVTLGFGEIVAAGRPQRRRGRPRLQPHERPARASTRSTRPASASGCTSTSACRRTSSRRRMDRASRYVGTSSTSCTGARSRSCSSRSSARIRLRDSRLGRAWIAIREDEIAAAAMGIPLMRTKTWSYASGAFFGGVAGAWFAIVPAAASSRTTFYFNVSVFILCMVILGGMGNVWGVIAGAAVPRVPQHGGPREHRRLAERERAPLRRRCRTRQGDLGRLRRRAAVSFGIYGIIIVVVMLVPAVRAHPRARGASIEFEEGVHDEPLYDVRERATARDD